MLKTELRWHGFALARLAMITTLALSLSGCASFLDEEKDPTLDWPAQRLYNAGKAALDDGVIKLNPRHPNVDYAYYVKGLARFDQGRGFLDRISPLDPSQRDPGRALESFEDFSVLVNRFPNSRYAKDARKRMLYLRNNLAKHELHVANYYMRRGAYVAAANRAKYVVENYDRAPSVPRALVVMSKAYKVLGLTDLSDDVVRVLRLNYPEHPGVKEIEALTITD
jgi:outer membrane protein assembly factor BamD